MITATYSPDDNKLRIYSSTRLDADTYARVRAAGFKWAPKQDLFVAPMWTPDRADLCLELAGEIDDEDRTLIDRAEERADRFEEYSDHRRADADQAQAAVARIADGIPLGQPILVGHHSERHARRDAERIEAGMRRAIRMWDTADYWTRRAASAIQHAKYKERPDVRARRIKTIEADKRKQERTRDRAAEYIQLWQKLDAPTRDGSPASPEVRRARAIHIANTDAGYFAWKHTHPSGYVGPLSLWEAAGGNTRGIDPEQHAIASPDEVRDKAIANHRAIIDRAQRWIEHYDLRLQYERAMMGESGGIPADKTGPEKGGACRCWASPRGGWSYIKNVNRISVTVFDNWGNGGPNFTRTIPFDKLTALMTRAQVDAARAAGRLVETADGTGFILRPEPTPPETPTPETRPDAPINALPQKTNNSRESAPESTTYGQRKASICTTPQESGDTTVIDAMRATLRAGITVQAVPQLFPTPPDVARQVVELAGIEPGHRVLEPSAGTGALLGAMGGRTFGADVKYGRVHAVEINGALCARLRADFPLTIIHHADFLTMSAEDFGGTFDRIVMNPPFSHAVDIRHIEHARRMLAPGGRLVAVCANGPRQRDQLQPLAVDWIYLPAGSFTEAGTNVNAAIVVLDSEDATAQEGNDANGTQDSLFDSRVADAHR